MKSVGIDGCRSGWISVSSQMEIYRFDTIKELIKFYGDNCFYLIDIPIGLETKNTPERVCEKLMRSILNGYRKSSVFNAPCREALHALTFEEATTINKLILGKGISKQSFFIFNKIREVDVFLRNYTSKKSMLKEAHPEIAFHFLNGAKSMKFNKKTQQGLQERLDILECYNKGAKLFFQEATSKFLRKDVAKDDIVDAMCLAICGSNLPNRIIATLPQKKELDRLRIANGCTL